MVLPCLMGVFNSIGGRCFGWIAERISAEADHLISYGDNIENLCKQVQDLSDAIESVKNRIQEAENNRGETLVDPVVSRLLERMSSLREEASKLITDEELSSDCSCIIRLRLNLCACYITSRSAKKAIIEAVELLEKEKKLDRAISNIDYSNCLGVTPNPDFEELESRMLVSNQIMEALKDPNVHKVGVYGMGGTGKTTLALKIGADLQLNGTFNYVVLATVSEKQSLLQNNYQSDLISIQDQIAGGLKLQLQGNTLNGRATQLREQLQKRDKLLIIFDDIWSKFELEAVGIPVGSGFTSKFKILMTSRSKMVLENEMDSRNNFGLDSLPPHDAQNLFDKMIGGDAHYSNWPLIAHQVVDLCGGIPILLVTTGRALRNATQSIWEDALTQLKLFDGEDIDEEAYKKIEVSYNFLKNEELKKLFLLCAQLDHRSIPVHNLPKYAIGLNLFKGRKTLKEVSSRLHKYLRDLKGCCLLQDGNEEGIIKMHDVVHKFASFVAIRDHHVFSVANDGELEEWPSKEQFAHFSTISFYCCHLPSDHELPVAFDNPKLESFLMLRRYTDAPFQIPDNLFVGMKGLKLMHLTRVSLSPVLVSSLGALIKLRTLCLDHCKLNDISVIGELPILQALSLYGSSIVLIPKVIGKLGSTLKLLDLGCMKLERIAAGVISRLTLLEDLRIGDSFSTWQRLEGRDKSSNSVDETDETKVASLDEFKNLQNLIHLEISIRGHGKLYPKDLVFTRLETFMILFAVDYWRTSTRTLAVRPSSTIVEFDSEGSKALMTKAESLLLGGVMRGVSVSEMDPKGFPELKRLEVESEDEIQYIVTKNSLLCIFPKLETLNITNVSKMERICDDHVLPVGSLENLRVIQVAKCELLHHLMSSNLARGLLCLKEIDVCDCESLENIMVSRESDNEEEIQIGFTHQLRVLKIWGVPRLMSFCNFKQLERLPSSTPFFNKKIMFPNLEVLKLNGMNNEKIWEVDHLPNGAEEICWLQNLTSLHVDGCDNLRYIFTSSMVKSLAQLYYLEVSSCDSMEEIIATREGEKEGEQLLLFPKLEYLELNGLRKLKRFCHALIGANESTHDLGENSTTLFDDLAIAAEETCRFPNLTKVRVSDCNELRYLFTFSVVKSLVKIKQLRVQCCASIEEIVALTERETAEDIQLSLPELYNIELLDLPKLKRFCEANLLECQSLEELVIRNCPELKTFMSANDSSSSDNSTTLFIEKVALPNMKNLEIVGCDSFEKLFDVQIFPVNESRILPFQNLQPLHVLDCDKIDLFGFNNTQQLNDEFIKVISSLESCCLSNEVVRLIKYKQRLELKIVGCGFQAPPILSAFLKSFPKLDEVKVSRNSIITHLFPCEPDHLAATATAADGDDMDTQTKTLVHIGLLRLTELSNMKQIWSEHSSMKYHVIPEVLQVSYCDNLLSLAPPFPTLFKYLTRFHVWGCPALKLVASSSIAKSLVNLKVMSVERCDSLEEIVGSDDQWSNGEHFVFDKLEILYLLNLNSLTNFCSTSDCNFQFPSLDRMIVMHCAKMKFFSKGALGTPKLIKVEVDINEDDITKENQGRWEGDLNSTIRQLFEEMEEQEKDDDGDKHGDENADEEISQGETKEEDDE